MESSIKWRYRIKFLEKIYFILLLAIGFIAYKSPPVMGFILYDSPHISITLISLSVLAFSIGNYLLEKRAQKSEKHVKSLKDKLKDAKRLLIS